MGRRKANSYQCIFLTHLQSLLVQRKTKKSKLWRKKLGRRIQNYKAIQFIFIKVTSLKIAFSALNFC